jgi:hypothetical protein
MENTNMTSRNSPDFIAQNGGSIIILRAMNADATAWIEENVSAGGYQPNYPESLIIEPRYFDDLAYGIQNAGLTVSL